METFKSIEIRGTGREAFMSSTTFTCPVPLSKSSLAGLLLAEAVGAPGFYSTTSHSGGVHRPGNVQKKIQFARPGQHNAPIRGDFGPQKNRR